MPVLIAVVVTISASISFASLSLSNKSCLNQISSSVVAELARLRVDIDEADRANARVLAVRLSADYQRKLKDADADHVPLDSLAAAIAEIRGGRHLDVKLDEEHRQRLTESEREKLDWIPVRELTENHGIEKMVIDSKGRWLVTGTRGGALKVWGLKQGEKNFTLPGHRSMLVGLKFSADDRLLLSAAHNNAILWDTETMKPLRQFVVPNSASLSCDLSSDGTRAAIVTTGNKLAIWDTTVDGSKIEVQTKANPEASNSTYSVSFNNDASRLLVVEQGLAAVYDPSSGARLFELLGHSGQINSGVFSPDGKQIITASDDGSAKSFDAATGVMIKTVHKSDEKLLRALFDQTGTRIFIIDQKGIVSMRDAQTAQLLRSFPAHEGLTYDANFSQTRSEMITGGQDGLAAIWNFDTGAIQYLKQHTFWVESVLFTPDGDTAITGSSDNDIIFWKKPVVRDDQQ